MKRNLDLGALLALLGALATGVTDEPVLAQPRTLRIALIAKSEANFVFLAARRGAEERAAALSRQHGATIRVSWLTPAKEDAADLGEKVAVDQLELLGRRGEVAIGRATLPRTT